jgi:hypothetical protein
MEVQKKEWAFLIPICQEAEMTLPDEAGNGIFDTEDLEKAALHLMAMK